MNKLQFRLLALGGFLMALAIILGVIGAHFLQPSIGPENYDNFKTANIYHRFHAISILVLIPFVKRLQGNQVRIPAWCFGIGILLFCGTLYLISVSEQLFDSEMKWLSHLAPVGGLSFIAGWLYLTFIGWKNLRHHESR